MKKNGEITSQQIILLIILIASFAVILFFLLRLNLGEQTNQELCRNSVVLQSRSVLPDQKSLSCYRTYTCITNDGTCEALNDPNIVEVDNKKEVYRELSKGLTDCWWMFGEGKVDYVGEDLTKNNYCSICSQVYVDSNLNNIDGIEGEINQDDLYEYMSDTEMPGRDMTYLQFLFGTNNLEQIKQNALNEKGVGTFGTMNLGEHFFVVMGITSEVSTTTWVLGSAAGVAAGAIATFTPIGWVGGTIIATGSIIGGIAGSEISENIDPEILAVTVPGRGIDNLFFAPTIVEAESSKFKTLNCEEIVTLP